MEDLVEQLAELQAEMNNELIKADFSSAKIDYHIDEAIKGLDVLRKERDINRQPCTTKVEEIKIAITGLHTTIIDEWTGEKKTLAFDAGTLKFRTTKSLDIHKPGTLLNHIMSSGLPVSTVAEEYIKGFNLTTVRKYLEVLPVTTDVAELIEKTTVKLEVV